MSHSLRLASVVPFLLVACSANPSSNGPEHAALSHPPAAPAPADRADRADRAQGETLPAPPVAPREPHSESIHGQVRVDDYYWLRKKGAPEVLGYLKAENAYTDAMTRASAPLRETLYREMLARVQETDLSVPVKRGNYVYYTRTEAGKQYPIYCRKNAKGDPSETVLLDLNEIGKTEKFVALGTFEVSDDGQQLAYALDTTGYWQYVLHVKDLRSGKDWPERIPRVNRAAWGKDGKTLLYVTEDATTKRSNQLHRHVLGQDPARDALVYDEKDERFHLELERSRSKEWIFANAISYTTTEVRIIPAAKPNADPVIVAAREAGHEYYLDHGGGLFYVRTNSGGRNFRLMTTKVSDFSKGKWKEIVAHRDDVMLDGVQVFSDHYVLRERQDGLPALRITYTAPGGRSERIEMPEPIYGIRQEANPEFESKVYRYGYQSFVTPPSVFEYDLASGAKKLLKRTEVPGGYDPAKYAMARLYATARDGTKVPISLLHRKEAKPGGAYPLFLGGYGAYGISNDIRFDSNVFSLVDRGAVVAVAHIRGGGELGKKWHDGGRMMNKMNTFTDFIDSAEYLVREGWTSKDRLAIEGGSAGGLLMGAVTNLRPDLFKAVLARVAFVDVINTMLDESLPETVEEFEEWGNPKIKEQYDYMMKYSPYDNVEAKSYPALLVRTSYNDSQVPYWESAKYVAKLRALKTDTRPLLFKINLEPAGHGGQSGRYNRLRERAFDYAFLIEQLGLPR